MCPEISMQLIQSILNFWSWFVSYLLHLNPIVFSTDFWETSLFSICMLLYAWSEFLKIVRFFFVVSKSNLTCSVIIKFGFFNFSPNDNGGQWTVFVLTVLFEDVVVTKCLMFCCVCFRSNGKVYGYGYGCPEEEMKIMLLCECWALMLMWLRGERQLTKRLHYGVSTDVLRNIYMQPILQNGDVRCIDIIRMDRLHFFQLCHVLRQRELLVDTTCNSWRPCCNVYAYCWT